MSPPDRLPEPPVRRPTRLMGPMFWAMLALCGLCIAGGLAVAYLAPRLL